MEEMINPNFEQIVVIKENLMDFVYIPSGFGLGAV